jgi:hypothetical protein
MSSLPIFSIVYWPYSPKEFQGKKRRRKKIRKGRYGINEKGKVGRE